MTLSSKERAQQRLRQHRRAEPSGATNRGRRMGPAAAPAPRGSACAITTRPSCRRAATRRVVTTRSRCAAELLAAQRGFDFPTIEHARGQAGAGAIPEIGAYNGVWMSNTLLFEETYGWTGAARRRTRALDECVGTAARRPGSRPRSAAAADPYFLTGAGPGARLAALRAAVAGGPDRHDAGDLRPSRALRPPPASSHDLAIIDVPRGPSSTSSSPSTGGTSTSTFSSAWKSKFTARRAESSRRPPRRRRDACSMAAAGVLLRSTEPGRRRHRRDD